MPDGATMSTPARAYETTVRARFSSDASLSSSRSWITPQWPWSVYSQKQASAITTSSGQRFLIALIARWTTPLADHASEPTASFFSGMPNRITDGMPASYAAAAASTALSTDHTCWPGIDEIGFCTPWPGAQNSG